MTFEDSRSPIATDLSLRQKDARDTINGRATASHVNPPLLRKLDQLSFSDNSRSSPTAGMLGFDTIKPSGEGSPATSQVSVGSVGPTLAVALLPKHFDLTPITRNTSHQYVEDAKSCQRGQSMMISPDETDTLHGENLAIPSDLQDDGPAMPGLVPGRKSCLAQPIEFPSRKFYTFTSREQYEDAVFQSRQPEHSGLTPYQPDRDDDLKGVGVMADEALQQIFAVRRQDSNSSASGESHANHRLVLQKPFPLDDRQTSIPSIHLAHPMNGSIASYTEVDDEESLQYLRDDDVSLSSRGSSLYLPDQDFSAGAVISLGPSQRGAVVLEEISQVMTENKPQKPMEWLQSMQSSRDQVAEAASSRLLRNQTLFDEHPQRRQTMPPIFQSTDVRQKQSIP